MLKIRVNGDAGEGKSYELLSFAAGRVFHGDKVLFLCHSHEQARSLEKFINTEKLSQKISSGGSIKFSGPDHKLLRVHGCWDCIVIDDLDNFPKSKEGSWLSLAESRLAHSKHARLAYSSEWKERDPVWVSKAVWWKPWTWNRGYWK